MSADRPPALVKEGTGEGAAAEELRLVDALARWLADVSAEAAPSALTTAEEPEHLEAAS